MRVGAFEQIWPREGGGVEQKFSKNSNAQGVARGWGDVKASILDWYINFFNFSSNFRSKINILFLQCFPMTMLGHHNDL